MFNSKILKFIAEQNLENEHEKIENNKRDKNFGKGKKNKLSVKKLIPEFCLAKVMCLIRF